MNRTTTTTLLLFVAATIGAYFFAPNSGFFSEDSDSAVFAENPGLVLTPLGDMMVDHHQWVTLVNSEPIRSLNNEFRSGENCNINLAGEFAEYRQQDGTIAVQYINPVGHLAGGTRCPDGTVFLLSPKDWHSLKVKKEEILRERQENITFVFRAATKNKRLLYRPQKEFGWVTVMNSVGVKTGNGFDQYGDSCSLFENEGPFYILGTRDKDGAKLILYDGEQGFGAQCGTGTMFWAVPTGAS